MSDTKRKLAAIVFTDIVGFTKLSSKNEPAALSLLEKQRDLLKPIVKENKGEWLKEIGDGLLLTFETNRDAVDCAIAIQHATKDVEGLNLRIGIHQGEVVFQGSDVVGDDVNIASRIEPFAAEGGIAISGRVNTSLERDPDFKTMFVGTPQLKGLSQKTEVYCITSHNLPRTDISKVNAKMEQKGFKWNFYSVSGAVLSLVGILFWLNFSFIGIGIAESSEVPSLAVLPFENKGSKEDDFYAYGISSDLIADVTSTGMLRVAGLADIEKLEYSTMSYDELAKKLMVRYIAKGTLWKMDTMFQLSMELFDTKESEVIWSNRWQTAWKELATIKLDLSDDILKNLNILITKDVEQVNIVGNPEAYEYYLKGQFKMEKRKTYEDLKVARGLFEKAIDLDSNLVDAMLKLAKSYRLTNEFDRSLEINKKALNMARSLKNKNAEGFALFGLGSVAFSRDGDFDKAMQYYDEGLTIADEIGDKNLKMYCLNNAGIIEVNRGNYDKALENFEEIYQVYLELDDKRGQVYGIQNKAVVYFYKGEDELSVELTREALKIGREIDDLDMQAISLSNIASHHEKKREYEIAISKYEEVLGIFSQLGDRGRMAETLNRIGVTQKNMHKDTEAIKTHSEALTISEDIADSNLIAITKHFISQVQHYSGDYEESLSNLRSSKNIYQRLNNSDAVSLVLYHIAHGHLWRGHMDSATVYLEMASEINNKIGNKILKCEFLLSKHLVKFLKGEESLDLLEKAASIAKEIGADEQYLNAQAEIGILHFYNEEYEKALEYLKPRMDWLIEKDEYISLYTMSNYLFCLKALGKEYDLSELNKLIQRTPEYKIDFITCYSLYIVLGDTKYLKNAYDRIMALRSNLEPEASKKFINYPIIKKILNAYSKNI